MEVVVQTAGAKVGKYFALLEGGTYVEGTNGKTKYVLEYGFSGK